MPVRGREVVAVDADRGGLRREALLHRRNRLTANDRVVREHGPQPVETDGPRAENDVHRYGPVRRELDGRLVRGPREELRRLGGRRDGPGSERRERGESCDDEAKHGATRVAAIGMADLQVYQDSNQSTGSS